MSALIEELQYTLGEGPCIDAHRQQRPVVEPDLADPDDGRWAAFARPAVDAGARAVFGFPMSVGDVRVGALNLYRDRPGPLTDDQHADAVVIAGVAARAIIEMQADAAPGDLGAGARGERRTSGSSSTRPPGWSPCSSASPSPRRCCGCAPTPSAADASSPTWPDDVVARRLRFDRPTTTESHRRLHARPAPVRSTGSVGAAVGVGGPRGRST